MNKRTLVFTLLASLIITMFPFRRHFARQQENVFQEQARDSFERLTGLQQRVTVVRDKFGAPHVTASSDHDAYFMMGYLHAQDRFFEMDLARRSGSGTKAELLGAGPGDDILLDDSFQRVIGTRRAAERSLGAYSPQAKALIQAYSDGVNAWLDRKSLPPEYAAL